MAGLHWDIFCRVVDNFGDIGVCWRLAAQLAARGHAVRLWIDEPSALAWMAPGGCAGVEVIAGTGAGAHYQPGEVVVEAFGGTLAPNVVAAIGRANRDGGARACWINLEYLSAEPFVARSHALESPVHGGALAGVRRWFYFPGFTSDTGGLLREADLMERRAHFDRAHWLARQGVSWTGEPVVSLFCYEPPALGQFLGAMARAPALLLVTHGRAAAAVRRAQAAMPGSWNRDGALKIAFIPLLSQVEFDRLLWCADCNFVRGEDSLVRALWAGAGLVWQAYPQSDDAHHAKLEAFLDWLGAPASLRRFHRLWNGLEEGLLPPIEWAPWRTAVERARARLLAQDDLVSRLLRLVAENR
ncbi:conserved hypothetical protein [Burkholderiales bacterium]|nr:conserved hypothetical protein [Burkholderiales bacterium]